MMIRPTCAALVVLVLTASTWAQAPPDLSGTWLHVPTEAGAEPRRLVLTQSATELVVVRRTTRGDESSTYRLDGVETVESNMLGDTRIRATWDGGTLVVARTRTLSGPEGPVPTTTTESYALDAGRLTVTLRRPMPQGGYHSESVVYLRDPQ